METDLMMGEHLLWLIFPSVFVRTWFSYHQVISTCGLYKTDKIYTEIAYVSSPHDHAQNCFHKFWLDDNTILDTASLKQIRHSMGVVEQSISYVSGVSS